jgi:hypothetical protein
LRNKIYTRAADSEDMPWIFTHLFDALSRLSVGGEVQMRHFGDAVS